MTRKPIKASRGHWTFCRPWNHSLNEHFFLNYSQTFSLYFSPEPLPCPPCRLGLKWRRPWESSPVGFVNREVRADVARCKTYRGFDAKRAWPLEQRWSFLLPSQIFFSQVDQLKVCPHLLGRLSTYHRRRRFRPVKKDLLRKFDCFVGAPGTTRPNVQKTTYPYLARGGGGTLCPPSTFFKSAKNWIGPKARGFVTFNII